MRGKADYSPSRARWGVCGLRSESDGLSSTACHLSTSGWFGRYSRFATEPVPTPSETATVGRSANDVLKGLAKRLSLTEDQKSKILPIIIERRQKIQEVWTSSTLFVRQKQGQVR